MNVPVPSETRAAYDALNKRGPIADVSSMLT
jgi:hypothetical protein